MGDSVAFVAYPVVSWARRIHAAVSSVLLRGIDAVRTQNVVDAFFGPMIGRRLLWVRGIGGHWLSGRHPA